MHPEDCRDYAVSTFILINTDDNKCKTAKASHAPHQNLEV